MKTGRIALALGVGLAGLVAVIGSGCSAAGDQPTRRVPSAEASVGVGGGAGTAGNETGGGDVQDSGSDVSQGGGGTTGGTGGYNPYGGGGVNTGGDSGGTGAGGAVSDAPPCSTPNTGATKPTGPNVWDGKSTNLNNTSNGGYWYSYSDGSSGLAVLPNNSAFGSGVVGGFIEASGLGTVTQWAGGIAAPFFNGDPTPVVDLSQYKGIVFQFKNSITYGAHFAISTWDFDPKFCICQQKGGCYAPYGVEIPKAAVADTVTSYWMCWPGVTCSGPGADAAADFPNPVQITLTSSMSGTVAFDPKHVLGIAFTGSLAGKNQWDFKLGTIRLF
jgi:hypothetical protein